MYKVNIKVLDSIRAIKDILLSEEALFRFDVIAEGTAMLLTIQKRKSKTGISYIWQYQIQTNGAFLDEVKSSSSKSFKR